jgi:4'-phosphopantetheinyl transferase
VVNREWQSLLKDEVHVWQASLDQQAANVGDFWPALSLEESARAARFRWPRDRERYVVSRGLRREILGGYLGVGPHELVFAHNRHGKPYLAGDHALSGLRFNVAHSHGLALFVVTLYREVGVDLEFTGRALAVGSIAEQFFSPSEVATLRALPIAQRRQAFYDCWTRKEAYLKARGTGLLPRMNAFDVSLRPGEAAAILAHREDPLETSRWSLTAMATEPGFAAALCVEGGGWRLRPMRYPPGS